MKDVFKEVMQESFDEGWSVFRLGEGYHLLVWDESEKYLAFVDVRLLAGRSGRPRERVAAKGTK